MSNKSKITRRLKEHGIDPSKSSDLKLIRPSIGNLEGKIKALIENKKITLFKIGKTGNLEQRLQNYHSDNEERNYAYIHGLHRGSPKKIAGLEEKLIERFLELDKPESERMCQNKDSVSSGDPNANILYVVYHTVESLEKEILAWLDEKKIKTFNLSTVDSSSNTVINEQDEQNKRLGKLPNLTLKKLVERLSKDNGCVNQDIQRQVNDKHNTLIVYRVAS